MNTVVVVADAQKASDTLFRAASGAYQSFGKTIGEAIDSLFRQSGGNDPSALRYLIDNILEQTIVFKRSYV